MTFDLIEGKPRDLGGFSVRRVLPSHPHRAVGPFVFFDHLGPAVLEPGEGVQVRPHPHIGLATVTFLFDGELMHRDSLGSVQAIRPGDVNWMTSGRGIVHSERSPAESLQGPQTMHAIQSWVALPIEHENGDPSFAHHAAATLPRFNTGGVDVTVVAGHAFGQRAPVVVLAPTLYVVARFEAGARLTLSDEHDERALYLVSGDVGVDGRKIPPQTMAVFTDRGPVVIEASAASVALLLGGAKLDAPRAVDWNFVASSREAIAAARDAWERYPNERFPQVPGETEFIPLPSAPHAPSTPL
jgi:redox-sensitive bicupin YhaK (pirin superfamily)